MFLPSLHLFLIMASLDGLRSWNRWLKSLKTSTVQHLLLAFNFLEPMLHLYQKHPQTNLGKQVQEY